MHKILTPTPPLYEVLRKVRAQLPKITPIGPKTSRNAFSISLCLPKHGEIVERIAACPINQTPDNNIIPSPFLQNTHKKNLLSPIFLPLPFESCRFTTFTHPFTAFYVTR